MKCALLGIRSKNEIRNVDVYKNAGFEDRVTRIAINKFNWKGYTVRLTDRKIDKGNFEQTIDLLTPMLSYVQNFAQTHILYFTF